MLSKPADQMALAWMRGDLNGAAAAESAPKLSANMAAAEAIGLRGTPTLIWRKANGSEGRLDGLPDDWTAVISSMGGQNHADLAR
jgi:thiol:disulfide interchange protein DsbG